MATRVLVVDDDPQTVKLICTALKREGFEVQEAFNGAECLLAVERELPDLVILDVTMPVMDGIQTLRLLRDTPKTKDLPVVLLTARKEDQDVTRGWSEGADFYLTKPFQVDELLTVARRITGATKPHSVSE